jgi:hypothetical protein
MRERSSFEKQDQVDKIQAGRLLSREGAVHGVRLAF